LEPVLAPGTPEQLHEIRDGRSLAASLTNGGVAKAGDLAKLGWPPNLVSFTGGGGRGKASQCPQPELGGVGAVTVATLMRNAVTATRLQLDA
jgi:hypothetical protein